VSRRTAPRSVSPLIARQKRAADRLRRQVMEEDGSLDHPYFRKLQRRVARFREQVSRSEMDRDLTTAGLIYIGDFHATPAAQAEAADLLRRLSLSDRPLALGVEFVYARQQRLLDRRQSGELDDATFLRRIHYREEWGYPWAGFRAVLDAARDLNVPVHALDAPPRGGYGGVAVRDEHAARRIAGLVAQDPARRWLIQFGESHLAKTHLPSLVRRRLKRHGIDTPSRVVLQNAETLYWQLVGAGLPTDRPVRIDDEAWCLFNTGPLEKYEAYRQVLDRWRGDTHHDDEIDLTPAVHHLIEVLCGWLEIRPDRKRLHHRAGWSEDLVDAFPEVYSGPEAEQLLQPIMEERGRRPAEIDEARLILDRRGALYDARSNTIFLRAYLPGAAAGVGAKFLRTALTGRLFISPDDFADDAAQRMYAHAYSEGLAQLGARLVDPASGVAGLDMVRAVRPAAGAWVGLQEAPAGEMLDYWIDLHRRFERSTATIPPRDLVVQLRQSRPLRRVLARAIGQRLGRALFAAVQDGSLGRAELRRLFARPLPPRSAARTVVRLLRRQG